ncbi:MAG: alanine racemase [Desulfobacteraceae bacterium]|jgi:alanine racemase
MPRPLIWAEINLSAIAHNVRQLRRIIHPKAQFMVAVKANGYGHGAVQVARTALKNGADQLGVARLQEGVELRRAGIQAPILIMGYTPAQHARLLLEQRLMPTLCSLENARQMSAAATALDQTIRCHIKVDSGMGRLGIPCDALRLDKEGSATDEIRALAILPGLDLAGLFTHFATADHREKKFAQLQFSRFLDLAAELETTGVHIPLKHAANSGAIIDMPETHLDMVRAGISVYGLLPSRQVDHTRIELQPAMELKAKVINIKAVPAGTKISYGGTWQAPTATTIATIAVGYGDGYRRRLSNRGRMIVGGKKAPIVGRVCMDLTMLDVGHIDGVELEQEVVLMGRQADECILADDIADQLDTINYEVVTALMPRVQRVYTM